MTNFLRSYEAELSKYTDAPEMFHRALATTLMGAMLTKYENRMLLYGGAERLWTNLWCIVVGDSGRSRKTTTVQMMAAVMARMEHGEVLRAPDDGSPEGFAKDLVKRERAQAGDAAAFMVQGEMYSFLSALMKDYMKSMKGMLMEFFDSPSQYKRTLSKEEFMVPRPRFSLAGGLASELLPTMTTSEDWLGGFLNRCILIHAVRTRELRDPGTPPPKVYASLAKLGDDTLAEWRKTRIREQKKVRAKEGKSGLFLVRYDDAAKTVRDQLLSGLNQNLDGQVNNFMSRAPLHLLKISAVEQVCLDPSSPFITKKAVEAASVLWSHYAKCAPALMLSSFARSNTDLEGDRLQRRIMRALQEAPDGRIREVELAKSTILDWERFQKAIASLEAMNMARRVKDLNSDEILIELVR